MENLDLKEIRNKLDEIDTQLSLRYRQEKRYTMERENARN